MMKALRGMKDIFDNDAKKFNFFINTASKIASNYGYSFISTPILEELSLFQRSVGASSDIVNKEMYNFTDKGKNDVCLRPEGTAGVVRSFIEHKFDRIGTAKRFYYHGAMFRYERPQKGRFRQFHQFGCESFATSSYLEDVNTILLIKNIFDKLNIKYNIKLNSLGCAGCMPRYKELLLDFLNSTSDICEDCDNRKEINPIRVLDCKNKKCQSLYEKSPKLDKHLCNECDDHFTLLKDSLTHMNIDFEVDLNLVRGLDYYTKTAFEFVSYELGSQSAIAGGGRYDLLVQELGGRATSAIGFAIGIDRILELITENDVKPTSFYIGVQNENSIKSITKVAKTLRQKYQVEFSYEIKSINYHFKKATKNEASFMLFIGEDEEKENKILVKNLKTFDEQLLSINELDNHEFI